MVEDRRRSDVERTRSSARSPTSCPLDRKLLRPSVAASGSARRSRSLCRYVRNHRGDRIGRRRRGGAPGPRDPRVPRVRLGGDRDRRRLLTTGTGSVAANGAAEPREVARRCSSCRSSGRQSVRRSAILALGDARWSDRAENAHPHLDCVGRVALVHNGIIENHRELAAQLRERGHTLASETDTEVVAHLIEDELAALGLLALRGGARRRSPTLEGDFALAVIRDRRARRARRGTAGPSPLIVGSDPHRRRRRLGHRGTARGHPRPCSSSATTRSPRCDPARSRSPSLDRERRRAPLLARGDLVGRGRAKRRPSRFHVERDPREQPCARSQRP